jgi:hypothetical protein
VTRALLVLAVIAACTDEAPPRPAAPPPPQAAIQLNATGETRIARRNSEVQPMPRDRIAATLAAPPSGEPVTTGHSTHGQLRAGAPHEEILMYVDAAASAADLVDVLDKVSPRAVSVALTNARRAPLPFVFAPLAVSHAAPIPIEVTTDGVNLYGDAVAWNDVPDELARLVEAQHASTSMNLSAALSIAPDVRVERVAGLIRAAEKAGFVEIDLAIDTTPPPAVIATSGPGVYDGAMPYVGIGQPSVAGDYDKAIIRRYIKRNIQKIQYCYEKQLLVAPGLQGVVAVSFNILPNGTTAGSRGSGVDPQVSACVASVVSGIEFPKPKGGGLVRVQYPFTFRRAGG